MCNYVVCSNGSICANIAEYKVVVVYVIVLNVVCGVIVNLGTDEILGADLRIQKSPNDLMALLSLFR